MDEMFFAVNQKAIYLDEFGSPVVCDIISHDDGSITIDHDSQDLIDWMDLKPDTYQLYKSVVDFLQEHSVPPLFVK